MGEATFVAIEGGLKWPDDCITRYLETGDESLLPSIGRPGQAEEEPEPEPPAAPSLADQMKAVRDELLLIAEERQRLAEREEAALHRAEELLVESGEPPERRGEPTERRVG
ncbi:hypothetical protein BAY60_27220 [Prauserella muralis]|uniref:Uncharacterized protein n=1 Tax=Prauserella muralis TaxID=588067 RepID=A0A2V4ALI3_9PSEU|nr:hypothetical protein BAY60_27220 [Prauserella muralis]